MKKKPWWTWCHLQLIQPLHRFLRRLLVLRRKMLLARSWDLSAFAAAPPAGHCQLLSWTLERLIAVAYRLSRVVRRPRSQRLGCRAMWASLVPVSMLQTTCTHEPNHTRGCVGDGCVNMDGSSRSLWPHCSPLGNCMNMVNGFLLSHAGCAQQQQQQQQ